MDREDLTEGFVNTHEHCRYACENNLLSKSVFVDEMVVSFIGANHIRLGMERTIKSGMSFKYILMVMMLDPSK